MTNSDVMMVLSRALNLLDYRIIDHGQRVAYIVHKMLLKENKYSTEELHKICFLCALHDIGAFKTEEIDSLSDISDLNSFELKNTLPHSLYGYLFLKNFSILKDYSEAILYHHYPFEKLIHINSEYKDLAAKIFLADRVDILIKTGRFSIDNNLFQHYRDTVFSRKDIDLLLEIEEEIGLTNILINDEYVEELYDFYHSYNFSETEQLSFLRTLSYLIDFRSEFTVLHNISTVKFSLEIAKLAGLNEEEINKIYYGAMLHDVGKISTSILILEKSDILDSFEYESIKDHVVMSEQILKNCIDDEILQIAIRHHEKLDGSGYPYGLTEKDLTLSEQIVSIADILSALHGKRSYKNNYSADKVKGIIAELANSNKISKYLFSLVNQNYESLVKNVDESCKEIFSQYSTMKLDYTKIYNDLKS